MIAEPVAPATGADLISRLRAHQVSTIDELHAINGDPHQAILEKHTSYLTPLLEEFITAAPFFTIATADGEGNCDVSPKGDPPGAVRVLDSRTIAIPDRPGNRRIDGHRNIIENPHIGLLFIIPNVDETVRVNGRAFITSDPELLAGMSGQGEIAKAGDDRRDRRGLHALRARIPARRDVETGDVAKSGRDPDAPRDHVRAEGVAASRRVGRKTAGGVPLRPVLAGG